MGERGWRLLAWRMTRDEARQWGERNHYEMDRVPRPSHGAQAPHNGP